MREFLLTLCVVTAVTYLLTGPVRKFAIIAGAMPEIRARDVHKEPTPRLGGIAMFGGLCAGLLVADHLSKLSSIFSNTGDVPALLALTGRALGTSDPDRARSVAADVRALVERFPVDSSL